MLDHRVHYYGHVYSIFFTEQAKKQYDALDSRLRRQVDKGLSRIGADPEKGKPLRGELRGIWSERVATFRILYKIYRDTIHVVVLVVEHRRKVYGGH